MIRRAIRSRRCERASAVLNGLPRLVERGGQDADFFGIEDARLGVYFKKRWCIASDKRFSPRLVTPFLSDTSALSYV